MICKLIESVKHPLHPPRRHGYTEKLPAKTPIGSHESNTAQVKPTLREQESCAVLEANSRGGKLLARKRERKGVHVHPRLHELPRGETPCTVK